MRSRQIISFNRACLAVWPSTKLQDKLCRRSKRETVQTLTSSKAQHCCYTECLIISGSSICQSPAYGEASTINLDWWYLVAIEASQIALNEGRSRELCLWKGSILEGSTQYRLFSSYCKWESWVTSQLDRMEDWKGAVEAFENSDGFVEKHKRIIREVHIEYHKLSLQGYYILQKSIHGGFKLWTDS